MTTMEWTLMAALVAAIALVALGWSAFWPEWPPIEPGAHRAAEEVPAPRRPRHRQEDQGTDEELPPPA